MRFISPAVRLAFLKCKRASLPSPTEACKAAGTKWYTVVEDLTGPTYRKMKEMMESSLVEKVWSIDGRLRFTIPGSKTVHKVKSIFADLSDIVKKD